jgi:manganese/zinc/iron transport system permease protein
MSSGTIIALVAILATSACTLAGIFLVLRRMAMMADAISHAVLPGLVAGYVLARGPSMIGAFLGAAAAGLLTVALVETLTRSRRVKEDAAIGIVFPALFALGVFVVSKYFANVHIDTDAILFGEIALTPFDSLEVGGRNLGPQSLWVLGGLTLLNALFLVVFYKELKLSTFDPGLAAALGFLPGVLHYTLMALISLTTVGAFTAVGAILAVALIIVPPVTASLLTRRLPHLIALALLVGIAAALAGYRLAMLWEVSISGMIATMLGVVFGITLLAAPQQGLVAQAVRRRRQKSRFATEMLVVHLASHEGTTSEEAECSVSHLETDLNWQRDTVRQTVTIACDAGLIRQAHDHLELTEQGRLLAQTVAAR